MRINGRQLRFRFATAGFVVALTLCMLPASSRGDALVRTFAMNATTVAEVFIEPGEIRVELEIGINDLPAFVNLLPDDLAKLIEPDAEAAEARIERFFADDLVIETSAGRLEGRLLGVAGRPRLRRDEITGAPLPLGPEEEVEPVVFAVLAYAMPFEPDWLEFAPPLRRGLAGATIGFVTYHDGVAVNDFRYLSMGDRLNLDWVDPWYSRFDNRNLRRQFYSPFSAYLYAEPFEIRQELVIRAKDLQHWVDLGLEGRETIPVDLQPQVLERAIEFLSARVPVTIDGEQRTGILDRAHFIYRNLRTSGVIDPPQELDLNTATMGIIFYFPTEAMADRAEMTWDLFTERIDRISAATTDEAGSLPAILMPEDATLVWQNFLVSPTIPGLIDLGEPPALARIWYLGLLALAAALLVVGLVGARRGGGWGKPVAIAALVLAVAGGYQLTRSATLSETAASEVLGDLLENVYRSFDVRDEEIIYDSLSRSVSGDLLTDVFLETRRALELENQGGARAKVQSVEMLGIARQMLRDQVGFEARSSWSVTASVGHWGHVHQRINQYLARITVKAVDGQWKITELELLEEARL